MAIAPTSSRGGYIERPRPSGLADVIDVILDKGLVIDAFVRVSLIGIEILTIDARIVIASVDTYLRFAAAANRLDLGSSEGAEGLPDLMESVTSGGAASKTKGVLEGVKEKITGGDEDSGDKDSGDSRPAAAHARRRAAAAAAAAAAATGAARADRAWPKGPSTSTGSSLPPSKGRSR